MTRLSLLFPVLFALPDLSANEATAKEKEKKLTQEDIRKIQTLSQEAYTLYQGKDHAKSNERFREILAILPSPAGPPQDPRIANIHYNMALNHYFLGLKKEALDSLAKAIAHGFWNHEFLARDTTMKDLREEKDYQALLDRCRRATPEMAFGLRDLTGNEIKKEDYEGKVLIIDIWGTWCPPCKEEIPHFISLQEKYGKDGLRVIGLTWEKRPPDDAVKTKVETFAKSAKINYTLALATEGILASINPRVEGFPTTFFIGRDGLVAERITGMRSHAELEAKVLPLLAAKPKASTDAGTDKEAK